MNSFNNYYNWDYDWSNKFLNNPLGTDTKINFVQPEYNSVLFGNQSSNIPMTTNNSWWSDFDNWVSKNFKNGWADLGQLGLGALNTGFGIYGGLKQLGLAQDQFNFTKNAFNTNLANTIKSYNTALEDKARSRYAYMTGDASNANDYIEKHKL